MSVDTAIYMLDEQLIPVILGHCKACNEPCKWAANGQGHDRECSCHDTFKEEA